MKYLIPAIIVLAGCSGGSNSDDQTPVLTPETPLVPSPEKPTAPEPSPSPDNPPAPEPSPSPDNPPAPEPSPSPDMPPAPEPSPSPDEPPTPSPETPPEPSPPPSPEASRASTAEETSNLEITTVTQQVQSLTTEQFLNNDNVWSCVYDRFTTADVINTFKFNSNGVGRGKVGEVDYFFTWEISNANNIAISTMEYGDVWSGIQISEKTIYATGGNGSDIVCELTLDEQTELSIELSKAVVNTEGTAWLCEIDVLGSATTHNYIFLANGSVLSNPSPYLLGVADDFLFWRASDTSIEIRNLHNIGDSLFDFIFDDSGNFSTQTANGGKYACELTNN